MNNMTMPTQLPGDKKWKGYTLEQLSYERTVALARIEVEKEVATVNYGLARKGNFGLTASLFSRITNVLTYTDYIVIAVQLYRSLSPLFKKKKK